jgi:hypothetical protein
VFKKGFFFFFLDKPREFLKIKTPKRENQGPKKKKRAREQLRRKEKNKENNYFLFRLKEHN